jgi:hypothetical protein
VDGKLRVGDYELSPDDVAMLMQTKAAADLRATQVPADPTGYLPELPKDLKLPEGLQYEVDPADPALADLRTLAKKIGLTQEDFSALLGVHVAREAASEAKYRTAMKGELDKLGANATVRVTALTTWLRGTVGDEIATAMRQGMFSAKIVQGLEILATKMASQGHASFSQAHREPQVNGRGPLSSMGEAEYNALSAQEKFRISRMGT